MLRKTLVVLLAMGAVGFGLRAIAGEGCDEHATLARDSGAQGDYVVFGIEIKSEKLRKALAGFEMDESKIRCPGCKAAMKTDGRCEHCHVSMAHGKAYRSPVAYALAKGKPVTEEQVKSCPEKCDECVKAYGENGFCKGCGVGFVAGRMFSNEEDYDAAKAAYATLTRAVKASDSCEGCAVAMVTDGTCDQCKVDFKDGKLVKHGG